MSNMIKAYAVRYKEELKVVDVEKRAEAIHARAAEAALTKSFVAGLQAVTREIQDGEWSDAPVLPDAESEENGFIENTEPHAIMDEAAMEAWREEERKKLKEELLSAERVAIRIEMEKELRTQADIILEQAKAQGEQVKAKARMTAEEEKVSIFEAAKREGYENGLRELQQEKEAMEASFAERERQLLAEYEQKTNELEPMATEVVIRLLQSLTGVCLETKRGIVTYLVSKALAEAERSSSFLIKVSKDDLTEVRKEAESFRTLFEREVSLEIVSDSLLKQGECMIETDSGIIDCSLGTQLKGLIEDIRLLSVQERV